MAGHDHGGEHVSVEIDDGVAVATIDHPPINLMTVPVFRQLRELAESIAVDDDVAVLVLRSADPGWWIAHFDVEAIVGFPADSVPLPTDRLNAFHGMCERFRTMPKITIAELAGRVGGGGAELAASLDLRYGARGRCIVNQPEVALGILPGGSGTQRWAHLTNRSRALEVVAGCDDIDADTAERWGWLTRALDPDDLRPFVDRLARRIASFPRQAVVRAKAAVDAALPDPTPGLLREAELFQHTLRAPETMPAMHRFLAEHGQTPEGEARLGELAGELWT
ncbi:MAG: enoyl-CoA hydratase/isomerase family protein [Actinomycetota bacterium]